MKFNQELFEYIVNLLLPHMSIDGRRALLTPIFFEHEALFANIDWTGNNRTFTVRFIQQLLVFGRLDTSEEALIALLRGVRSQGGRDYREKIDALLEHLYQMQSTIPPNKPPTGRAGNVLYILNL